MDIMLASKQISKIGNSRKSAIGKSVSRNYTKQFVHVVRLKELGKKKFFFLSGTYLELKSCTFIVAIVWGYAKIEGSVLLTAEIEFGLTAGKVVNIST